jgi:hypothetical protein
VMILHGQARILCYDISIGNSSVPSSLLLVQCQEIARAQEIFSGIDEKIVVTYGAMCKGKDTSASQATSTNIFIFRLHLQRYAREGSTSVREHVGETGCSDDDIAIQRVCQAFERCVENVRNQCTRPITSAVSSQ